MKGKHVAFCLEQQYGHIVPSLGIAMELRRRGHRVTYAIAERFSSIVSSVGARAKLLTPIDTRRRVISEVLRENDCFNYKVNGPEWEDACNRLLSDRTADSLRQLAGLYHNEMPDLIVHDDIYDFAGRTFATAHGIPKVRLLTQFLDPDTPADIQKPTGLTKNFAEDEVIILTVPKFMQRHPQTFDKDQRFHFVGFIPEGRSNAFVPWNPFGRKSEAILISATTGILPQLHFCETMVDAFRDQPWDAVLSISGFHDATSSLTPDELPEIPPNIKLNLSSANFDIMPDCRLFIGQGGQGSTLEALFCGIPQIVIPPTPYHFSVGRRIHEMGLGTCLPISDMSKVSVIDHVTAILKDDDISERVRTISRSMRSQSGAELAANIIEGQLFESTGAVDNRMTTSKSSDQKAC